ncbi:hypothetical protein CSC70_06175 [Pseudoxanthomonas kalamensis DSM 18571]|nr:hypothetical protein CSC70_06175 [Pseudoxanthomonas kalamensis DSM 18571]
MAAVSVACLAAGTSMAAVGAGEAAKLKSELTPLGGERAANADGSIPAWEGKMPAFTGKVSVGDIPTGVYANEKPIFQVTAANAAQYKELLSEGTRALLAKYPKTFRLDVYPTHRVAVAPQKVYSAALKNATSCKLTEGGNSIQGCIGGTPFPIPKQGAEVIWNFLMRVEAPSIEYSFKNIISSPKGAHTLATRNDIAFQYPYYYDGATADSWNGEYALFRFNTLAPPFKAGESLVIRDSIDPKNPRQAWQYLVGQRRVRRAPTVAYDTPDFVASGANYFDEVQGFFGAPDRYSWKLIGKREMLIPANNNNLLSVSDDKAISGNHLNPEYVRWEKRRVWVVEATVAAGKRHAVPKRRYYFDEDTWLIALVDGYDAKGSLWRTSQVTPYLVPKLPATLMKTAVVFNLQAGTMSVIQALNGEKFKIVPKKPESYFTGDAVAAEGVR